MNATSAKSQYEIERNKPMPNRIHGMLQGKLLFLLQLDYRKQFQFISELSLATTPGSTPDICVYPAQKLRLLETEAKETEAPITTIEIQSPSQSIEELLKKAKDLYFPMGVQSAWIVIPALKAIQVLWSNDQKQLFTSGLLKDSVTEIEIDLEQVFEDLE